MAELSRLLPEALVATPGELDCLKPLTGVQQHGRDDLPSCSCQLPTADGSGPTRPVVIPLHQGLELDYGQDQN